MNPSILRYLLALTLPFTMTHGADYHLSPLGNDNADGLTPATAWQTLQKANEVNLQPGDKLLLASGGRWKGQLRPKGSGAQDNPIRLDRYGSGPLPRLELEPEGGVALRFENQEFWEVSNLEITASDVKEDAVVGGIHFVATTAGKILSQVTIRDCVIRNLGGSFKEYESCGIWVGVEGWDKDYGFTTTFHDVRIENNKISSSGRCGILVWTCASPAGQTDQSRMFRDNLLPSEGVVIRKNQLENLGGDAILVLGSVKPLIEYNTVRRTCLRTGDPAFPAHHGYNPHSAAVWLHSCIGGIMQFNEVTDSGKQPGNNDGMAFDFDFNCADCLVQYNVSRNNGGGFILIMQSARNNIARYNLSIDDRDHLLYLVGRAEENNLVYNNTFHVTQGDGYIIPRAKIWNNIFVVGNRATLEVREGGGEFLNNCYVGRWKKIPEDAMRVTEDPLFENPTSGKDLSATLRNYSLRSSSPCRGRGKIIADHGGRDLRGTQVPVGTPPDLGALQRVGSNE